MPNAFRRVLGRERTGIFGYNRKQPANGERAEVDVGDLDMQPEMKKWVRLGCLVLATILIVLGFGLGAALFWGKAGTHVTESSFKTDAERLAVFQNAFPVPIPANASEMRFAYTAWLNDWDFAGSFRLPATEYEQVRLALAALPPIPGREGNCYIVTRTDANGVAETSAVGTVMLEPSARRITIKCTNPPPELK